MNRIAIVVPDYENSGGVKTVANFLINALKIYNYELEIFSLATGFRDPASKLFTLSFGFHKKSLLKSFDHNGLTITKVGAEFPEIEVNRYKPRSELTNRLNEFDLVQIVAGTPAWVNVCSKVVRPVVLQVATLTNIERKEKLLQERFPLNIWKKIMSRQLSKLDDDGLELADAIMVENYWMEDLMKEKGYKDKTHFAPPGVDTSIFKPKPEMSQEYSELIDNNFLLSVGRFSDPRKDVKTLFKAYYHLKKSLKNPPKLVLAGKTMPQKEVMDLGKSLGILDDVILKKDVSYKELVTLYQQAEIFVLSSREEGLGMVIMEAMACGTPVVSTDCGGPRTLITDGVNGFLTEVGNEFKLAEKIVQLTEDKPLHGLFKSRSLDRIVNEFSLDKTVKEYMHVYGSLIQTAN